jgi:plasmid stabilization system protein ParE
MRLIWAPQALIELDAVRAYIAKENAPPVADRFISHLIECVSRMAEVPGIGKCVQSPIFPDARRLPVRPYWVYYRERSDTVEILRIWHYRQSELKG